MQNKHKNGLNNKGCPKGKVFSGKRRQYLLKHWQTPATMLMVKKRSGIMRSSITRPRQELSEMGLLVAVGTEKKPCQITGRKAMYYVAADAMPNNKADLRTKNVHLHD